MRQNTPLPRPSHPSSLGWSSARMAAMRVSAWATEGGSARPTGGRVSASARKCSRRSRRSARKSSSLGRGSGAGAGAALLRDLRQPERHCGTRSVLNRPTCTASRGRGGVVVWLRHRRGVWRVGRMLKVCACETCADSTCVMWMIELTSLRSGKVVG